MRLANSLFVQNNMANNTQNNKLAKNIPHFAGEQSQYATTPPGLARAYAGVKPLSFKGVTLEELEIFLKNNHRQPQRSCYYTNIKKVIADKSEALCVWMHSCTSLDKRLVLVKSLQNANLNDRTFEVAKNAIIKARLQANSSNEDFITNLKAVDDKLTIPLREALISALSRPQQNEELRRNILGVLNQETPLTDIQKGFLINLRKTCSSRLERLNAENNKPANEKSRSNLNFFLQAIRCKFDGINLGTVKYADGLYSYDMI